MSTSRTRLRRCPRSSPLRRLPASRRSAWTRSRWPASCATIAGWTTSRAPPPVRARLYRRGRARRRPADAEADAALLGELAAATGAGLCITVFDSRPSPPRSRRSGGAASTGRGRRAARARVRGATPALRRLQDAVDVCGAVGWERCGVLLDSWHFFRGGAPWELLRSLTGNGWRWCTSTTVGHRGETRCSRAATDRCLPDGGRFHSASWQPRSPSSATRAPSAPRFSRRSCAGCRSRRRPASS